MALAALRRASGLAALHLHLHQTIEKKYLGLPIAALFCMRFCSRVFLLLPAAGRKAAQTVVRAQKKAAFASADICREDGKKLLCKCGGQRTKLRGGNSESVFFCDAGEARFAGAASRLMRGD